MRAGVYGVYGVYESEEEGVSGDREVRFSNYRRLRVRVTLVNKPSVGNFETLTYFETKI